MKVEMTIEEIIVIRSAWELLNEIDMYKELKSPTQRLRLRYLLDKLGNIIGNKCTDICNQSIDADLINRYIETPKTSEDERIFIECN